MSGFRLPGVVWSALLVALPLLSVWLADSFPGAVWVTPVAGLLLIIAKVVAVFAAADGVTGPPVGVEGAAAAPPAAGKRQSVWWG